MEKKTTFQALTVVPQILQILTALFVRGDARPPVNRKRFAEIRRRVQVRRTGRVGKYPDHYWSLSAATVEKNLSTACSNSGSITEPPVGTAGIYHVCDRGIRGRVFR
jgi:hypothetical protein